ncbi:hemolysin-type calcium-binding region [Chrysochromulina tobinii]|uniref:Hemolysin-type calcium-binding region n=1 Tax=Chrysochromulina tobinii TaxID=1460289 RepID=A0A0M0J8G1_9EUKA|nr:hemolysin-type calcium-binding region [Chrysochromulina tobinii]|eukprot:KOO22632.1 hemolysin-type calcium-binding region [Chrysochromulina sp. CCMP291]
MVAPCVLADVHEPLAVEHKDGHVIESLHVRSSLVGRPAILCRDSRSVVLRKLLIEHVEGGVGIRFERCPGLRVEQVEVRVLGAADDHARPTANCHLGSSECHNIHGVDSADVILEQVRVTGGSSGIELQRCARAQLRDIVGRNVRGPYPRGQCVQFTACDHALLERFHCVNELGRSWPEDSISVWRSREVTVREGLVDGNNAPNGVGVMFENDDERAIGGLLEHVDAIHMGGGCFSGYPAAGLLMRHVRCGWNHCEGVGGREAPASGGQMYAAGDQPHGVQGYVASHAIRIVNATAYAPCDPYRRFYWSRSEGAYAATPEVAERPRFRR